MTALARGQGMKPTVLLTKKATRSALLSQMRKAAKALKAGDPFFLSFLGHGGQVPDTNRDDRDRKDETWCLFDGQLIDNQLIDDELYFELSRFAAGMRVLMLSDSCHSGTITCARTPPPPPGQRAKLMPDAVALRVYDAHKTFYDQLQADVLKQATAARRLTDPDAGLAQVAITGPAAQAVALVGAFKPSVLLISGCQDNQSSMDGEHNGAFTERLLQVWNYGRFSGSYAGFHARIRSVMPASQSPNLYALGPAVAFLQQAPFSV